MSFFDELRLFVFGSGKCGYCNQYHGGSKEFWDKRLGKKIIFTQMSCYDSWLKENYFCSNCEICNPYSNDVVQHKFKRKYYYFCSLDCRKEWKEMNPDKCYDSFHRHSIPSDLRKIVWNRDKGICVKCGSKENIHYDHIIPVSKGGSTIEKNLELLCQQCNLSKSDKIE